MVGEDKYFDYLYQALEAHDLVPGNNLWRAGLEQAIDDIGIDRKIFRRLQREFRADFNEVALMNTRKYILLSRSFHVDMSCRLITAAVYFVTLGCFLDYMTDSGCPHMRARAEEKLSWDHCKKWFIDFDPVNGSDVDELLFAEVSKGLKWIHGHNRKMYIHIIDMLEKAAKAQRGIMDSRACDASDISVIYDKSVLFTKTALLIAVGNKRSWSGSEWQAVEDIGAVFAYIDDLIDFFEDKAAGQKNIMAVLLDREGHSCRHVIDAVVREVHARIDRLNGTLENSFAELIKNEIREWIFSSRELTARHYKYGGSICRT